MDIKKLKIENSAILVIDIQNDFCSESGVFSNIGIDVFNIRKTVPKIINFIDEARKFGIPIAFIKGIYDKKFLTQNIYERNKKYGLDKLCLSRAWGSKFYKINPEKNDQIFVKHRYDAFTNPKLLKWLKSNNIKFLILTGFSSDVCVDSTARSGFMNGFYVITVKDCLESLGNKKKDMAFYEKYYGALVINSRKLLDFLKNKRS